ncbi:hypothetical protein PAPHI01_0695 [Pancytospora philotis]|nr:hypothetical protein PAPHI01_0695 [Pancytospora philotis]
MVRKTGSAAEPDKDEKSSDELLALIKEYEMQFGTGRGKNAAVRRSYSSDENDPAAFEQQGRASDYTSLEYDAQDGDAARPDEKLPGEPSGAARPADQQAPERASNEEPGSHTDKNAGHRQAAGSPDDANISDKDNSTGLGIDTAVEPASNHTAAPPGAVTEAEGTTGEAGAAENDESVDPENRELCMSMMAIATQGEQQPAKPSSGASEGASATASSCAREENADGKQLETKAHRKTRSFRGSISDIEDVSTDHEFIKINVFDRRTINKGCTIDNINVREIRQPPKTSKSGLKVNKHYIGPSAGLDGAFDADDAPAESGEYSPAPSPDALAAVIMAKEGGDTVAMENEPDAQPSDSAACNELQRADLIQLIGELNNHIMSEGAQDRQIPQNRYVITQSLPLIAIDDVIDIGDFRERDLYDYVQRRTSAGNFKRCWVQTINGQLICYRSTAHRGQLAVADRQKVFVDPNDGSRLHDAKMSLDLSAAKLYLGKKKRSLFHRCFCCCSFPLSAADLFEITGAKIRCVSRHDGEYTIDLHRDGSLITLHLADLDLAFEHDNRFYYFRFRTVDSFLKWVLVYHLRRERNIVRLS